MEIIAKKTTTIEPKKITVELPNDETKEYVSHLFDFLKLKKEVADKILNEGELMMSCNGEILPLDDGAYLALTWWVNRLIRENLNYLIFHCIKQNLVLDEDENLINTYYYFLIAGNDADSGEPGYSQKFDAYASQCLYWNYDCNVIKGIGTIVIKSENNVLRRDDMSILDWTRANDVVMASETE